MSLGEARRAALAAALLLTLLGVAGTASADDIPPQAFELYEAARASFESKQYAEAAAQLERARALAPGSANLVYNLARALELAGDTRRAVAFYEEYAGMIPQGSAEYAETEATIERLEASLAPEEAEPAVVPTPVEEPEARGDDDGWVAPTLLVAGGVLAAGAVTFGVLALSSKSDAEAARTKAAYDDASGQRTTFAIVSDVCAVGAVAALGVGLFFLLSDTDERDDGEATSAAVPVSPRVAVHAHGAAFGLGGAF